MPRLPRLDIPGLLHHAICRGIERREIFKDEADYGNFLDRLARLAGEHRVKVYAFCLMPNHVHLLVKPLAVPLSTFMRRLLTGYAIYFNKRHRRAGHLFQNRYKSYVVEEDVYLLELIRYVHLNPVRAGIVSNLKELAAYPYSSYSSLMGKSKHGFCEREEVLQYFSKHPKAAKERLYEFMRDGIAEGKRDDLSGGGLKRSLAKLDPESRKERQAYDERILGTGLFVESVLKEVDKEKNCGQEDVLLKMLLDEIAALHGLTVFELCSGSKRASVSKARNIVILFATKNLGIVPKKLSEVLNVAPSTVYDAIRLARGKEGLELHLNLNP